MTKTHNDKPRWSLPYETVLPADLTRRKQAIIIRIVAYVALAAFLLATAIQFQVGTMSRHRKTTAKEAATKAVASTKAASQGGDGEEEAVKKTKGAIGRWRYAVRNFWAGQNIYLAEAPEGGTAMHPNIPFTVILLTPFAYMPVWAAAASFNLLKIAAIVAAFLMMVRVADHDGGRMPDWAALAGAFWGIKFIAGDIQHGNTNDFVLAAIVLHLWLYRRGWDILSGASLAAAVCLKMTPALFLLYWLYQRSWKVLIATIVAISFFFTIVPAIAVGPERAVELTKTWLDNLIIPGLVKGAWYPIHINQSVSGVLGRYLLDKPESGGDIYWNPDDNPYNRQFEHGWIAFASLTPQQAKMVVRVVQLVIVVLIAWAIGWRKLPRDDGRRSLHYGLVAIGMMLLNQRTWDHHAPVLLVATVAVWYGISRGRISRAIRSWAVGLMIVALTLVWLSSNGVFIAAAVIAGQKSSVGNDWADLAMAYGPIFYSFLAIFAACVILSVALRRQAKPYANGFLSAGESIQASSI